MDIIVKGRRTGVPERFRQYATGKLAKIEKLDHKAIRIDVEVTQERNPRQADQRDRVELTIRSRGPVIRAEAAADDRFAAFDLAFAKLEARLRKACDRRKSRHAERASTVAVGANGQPAEVATAPGSVPPSTTITHPASSPPPSESDRAVDDRGGPDAVDASPERQSVGQQSLERFIPIPTVGDGPLLVREKVHTATPMTLDQALLEMELVGHDFYLFHDSACGLFSVVYRRRGYDYGVIRLLEKQE